jgi:hypothetical protein
LFDPRLDLLTDANITWPGLSGTHPETGCRYAGEMLRTSFDHLNQVRRDLWRYSEIGPTGEVLAQNTREMALRWTYRWGALSSAQAQWPRSRSGVQRFRLLCAGLRQGIDPDRASCVTFPNVTLWHTARAFSPRNRGGNEEVCGQRSRMPLFLWSF